MNQDIKDKLRFYLTSLIGGLLIQFALMKLTHLCQAANLILPALCISIAFLINSIIYLVGCIKMSHQMLNDIEKGNNSE